MAMKRMTSVLLVFALLFGMFSLAPVQVFAEEPPAEQTAETGTEPTAEPEAETAADAAPPPVHAAEDFEFPVWDGPCDCANTPIIHLAGGHGTLFENEGAPEEVGYYGMSIENIVRDLLPGLDSFIKTALKMNMNNSVTAAIDLFWNWIGPLEMRPDGTSVKELTRTNDTNTGLWRDHTWEYWIYTMSFDWRESPLKTADDLHAFIQRVKTATGHSKVHLQSISGSGSVLAAYVDKYVNQVDDPDVLSVVLGQSTAGGLGTMGELFRKKININPQALSSFTWISTIETSGVYDEKVLPVLKTLYQTGIFDLLAVWFPYLSQKYIDRIYDELILPTYGSWPGLWAWLPNKDYAEAKKVMFKGHPDYYTKGFVDTIDEYYNKIAVRQDEIFAKANEKIKVAIMAGYGSPAFPIGNSTDADGDGLVHTEYASLGGTVALFGRVLPRSYKQALHTDCSHISPDRIVDASTCALPDNTWFMKGALHQGWYEYGTWYGWWREAPKGEDTVFDHPKYPQFVQVTSQVDFRQITGFDEPFDIFEPLQPPGPMTFKKAMAWLWDRVLGLIRVFLGWGGRDMFKLFKEPLFLRLFRFLRDEIKLLV